MTPWLSEATLKWTNFTHNEAFLGEERRGEERYSAVSDPEANRWTSSGFRFSGEEQCESRMDGSLVSHSGLFIGSLITGLLLGCARFLFEEALSSPFAFQLLY